MGGIYPFRAQGVGLPRPLLAVTTWPPSCDRYVTGRITDGMVASHARPSRMSGGMRQVVLTVHVGNPLEYKRRSISSEEGVRKTEDCNEEPAGMPPCMIRSRRCTRAMLIVEKGDDEEIQQLMVVRGIINNSSKIFRVVKFCCKAIRVLNRAFEMYFVVIDDMSAERWCDIEPAFPVDDGISITIVVTTNIQSIDNACSTADGYVYKMGNSTLNIRKICSSKVLLLRIVHQTWREAQNNFGRNSMEYKLLQVLDLEECDGFMDGYLDSICKLLLLKYVSIGGAVTTLPKTIAGLKLLETLDFRRNKVEVVIISVEVLVLPKLIHLFGKFELPGSVSNKIQKKIEPGKSNLQILAGFIAANNHGFVKLMCHMKNLRKVNIWCKSITKGNKLNSLSIAIEKFIENSNDPNDARTLSVDFSQCSEDILQISI
uniref:Disease resistance R13L4/SHOC-2-like LRR domain-containing protein n=3 Tax=Oryza TaxID=4527 RepID=Q7G3B1_ORYSJ|nr:hypothetical protein [Oryza sativa Japonica Group]AAP53364.1 hypothetical protein LOC_Os10g22350 [Oryza sativa Japonica Group]